MSAKTVITCVKIRPYSMVFYPSYEMFNLVRGYDSESQKNLQDNRVKGVLSKTSAKKMRDLVTCWLNIVRSINEIDGKKYDSLISFITLTLSSSQGDITDNEIKRELLNPFLIWLKQSKNVSTFIWKAEAQNNGNIHFHILVNKFIPWRDVRDKWNELQNKFFYIDQFEKKHGHRDANSTDIHGLYKDKNDKPIRDIGSYLAKYMSKNEELKRGINGRLWGRSDNLLNIEFFKTVDDGLIDNFYQYLIKKDAKRYKGDFFLLIKADIFKEMKIFNKKLYSEMIDFYRKQADLIY